MYQCTDNNHYKSQLFFVSVCVYLRMMKQVEVWINIKIDKYIL